MDFQFYYLPCKHLLAIFTLDKSALDISKKYLNSKYFNIDRSFLKWINEKPDENHENAQSSETSNAETVQELFTATSSPKPTDVRTVNTAQSKVGTAPAPLTTTSSPKPTDVRTVNTAQSKVGTTPEPFTATSSPKPTDVTTANTAQSEIETPPEPFTATSSPKPTDVRTVNTAQSKVGTPPEPYTATSSLKPTDVSTANTAQSKVGTAPEPFTATRRPKPTDVSTANAALNKLKNFINNTNSNRAIDDCVRYINEIFAKLNDEYKSRSSFSKPRSGATHYGKPKVPFSFLKRTMNSKRRIRKKCRGENILLLFTIYISRN